MPPAALRALIERLLRKDADEREPDTARAVADELARIDQPAEAVPQPAPRRRPWALAACAVLAVAVGLAGYLCGGTVIRIVTDKGELVVEVDDPNIEVKIVRGDAVLVDKTKNREFVLKAGDGEVIFFDPTSEVTTVARKFELKRGAEVRVRATMVELAAKRPSPPVPAAPPAPPVPVPAKVESAQELFAAGSVWRGVKMIETGVFAGLSTVYVLRVETRDGEKFTGHVNDNGPNRNPASVTGTVRGTAIEWKEVPLNNPNHNTAVRATRTGTVLAGDTIGRFPPGPGNTGRAVLYRVPRSGEPVPADFVPVFDGRLASRLGGPLRPAGQVGGQPVRQAGRVRRRRHPPVHGARRLRRRSRPDSGEGHARRHRRLVRPRRVRPGGRARRSRPATERRSRAGRALIAPARCSQPPTRASRLPARDRPRRSGSTWR